MTDFFSEFDSTSQNETSGEDPVAAFLAREKEELDKIENDNFGNFGKNRRLFSRLLSFYN
jgi:hypothetical protein